MATAFTSDPSFHALHVVRIRGRAPIESVRAAVGRPDVIELLRPLAEQGHVEYKSGRAPGWALTAQGRAVHAELLAAEDAPPERVAAHLLCAPPAGDPHDHERGIDP